MGLTSPEPASVKELMAAGGSVRCLKEHQETLDAAKSWAALYQTDAGVQVWKQSSGCSGKPVLEIVTHQAVPAITPDDSSASAQKYWIASQGMLSSPGAWLKI